MNERIDRIIGNIAYALEIAAMVALLPLLAFFVYISL
jgi:hypothetical protein